MEENIIIIISILAVILAITLFFVTWFNKNKRNENDKYDPHYINYNSDIKNIIGQYGEQEGISFLIKLIGKDGHLLNNVILKDKHNNDTEIDVIAITKKGLFCIEIKKWSGFIYGEDNDDNWVQEFTKKPNKIARNPIKQNKYHCAVLSEYIGHDFYVDNIVLFVGNCELYSESKFAFTRDTFKNFYNSLKSDSLDNNDIEYLYSVLEPKIATIAQMENFVKQKSLT